jgi:hypothetical protein
MSAAAEVDRLREWARMPMQWRGSDDAVTWSEWRVLPSLDAKLEPFMFYQASVWRDGRWHTSPIGCD